MIVSPFACRRSHSVWNLSRLAAFLLAAAAISQSSVAQNTHLWTQSRVDEFEKGTPRGVAITSDGHLQQGPGLSEVLTTPSTFVWSVAVDKSGTAYIGTASPATVLRVGPDGNAFTLFETKDVSVQVVRLGPESSATGVFDAGKLDSAKSGDSAGGDGKADPSSHYIWDMTFDSAGRLYIATGGPGAVYRVDPNKPGAAPETFFKSDEEHIRCLAWDAKGNLIAGSDGSGLVYQINAQGKGYVLFETPKREITAVAVGANGTIYAASVGDKSHNPLPPLPVQGLASISITVSQPGSLQAANASTSVPEGSEIYAIAPVVGDSAQAPRKLWADKDDIVYGLAARPDGLLALTGNRGHVFRIHDDGSYADVAHIEAQQGLSIADAADGILIGSGNTGKLLRLGEDSGEHAYASDVLDAGSLARYGRIEVEPGSTGFELWTRSGNVEQPARGRGDWGWSDWQPLKDGAVASPPGRFFEWKAVLHPGAKLGGVGVNYLPVNAAPVVDDLMVVPGARVSPQGQPASFPQMLSIVFPSSNQNTISDDGSAGAPLQAVKDRTAITVRWAAHDDNSDDLIYSLYLRGDGEKEWRQLKDKITDKFFSFDTALIPDGGYQIKVVASDAPSNTPANSLSGEKVSERFEVDSTPPVVTNLKASAEASPLISFDAEDAFSPIAHAEYSLDAGPWQFVEPVGGLSDSKREHYELRLPALTGSAKEHLISVRVYDRYDNAGLAKTVFTVPAK